MASRIAPNAASPISTPSAPPTTSHGRRVSAGSSASAAGEANTASAIKVKPHTPISATPCASQSGVVSA